MCGCGRIWCRRARRTVPHVMGTTAGIASPWLRATRQRRARQFTEACNDRGILSVSVAALAALCAPQVAMAGNLDELVAAAKKEGELTVITLPHDWCGYGDVIETFKKKYGIKVNELNPEGSSADEIEAVKANKGNKGPQAPDVLDIGLSFGPTAKADGLIAPYKVSTWDSIPAEVKDADGYWYGDYYGVMSIAVNRDIIKNPPADWSDLTKPEFKGAVSLPGDPRGANEAIQAVFAAGLSASNGDKAAAAAAGLKFFADINKSGNFVPVIGKAAALTQGTTPITLRWDYNNLSARDAAKGNPPIDVLLPKTGVVAG
eukprot:gene23035-24371_t